MTAHDPAIDFEALSRQVLDAWSRQWAPTAAPAAVPPIPGMDGLRSYLDWMQQAATSAMGQAGHGSAPTAPFAGWPWPGQGAWPQPGLDGLRELLNTPAFGHAREQQAEQQALVRAMLDHHLASARYQQLIARAQAQGAERLQRKLAEPGTETPSLKALYDLWVDAAEEAYAEIALSDEFREAYAAQTNTQMRVRQLQRQQVEQWCREVGLPTRSEIDTLGQRLQELRRELRRKNADQQASEPVPAHTDAKTSKRRVAPSKAGTRAKAPGKSAPRRAPRKTR